ncbi:MAG: hypothetical protein AB7S26_37400 [Sandaracinaceae bacterium]
MRSRPAFHLALSSALSSALALGCTTSGDVLRRLDAGDDAGAPESCDPGMAMGGAWTPSGGPNLHVIDGAFTPGEWDGVRPLEGLYTDAYMDLRGGWLHVINDWRANQQGIRGDCNNRFLVSAGGRLIDIRVFGDGRVSVDGRPVTSEGAYGLGSSPRYAYPHTIFEFRVRVDATEAAMCCLDPVSLGECDTHVREPMVFMVQRTGGSLLTRSAQLGLVRRLGIGEPCGDGSGVCEDGLTCWVDGRTGVCIELDRDGGVPSDGGLPDAAMPDEDAGPADAGAPDSGGPG